jgi:hypothetical protein
MRILLGDFNEKTGKWTFSTQELGMTVYIRIVRNNNVRIAKFATSKYLTITSTMFPYRNIHKYTWTYPNGKTNNQSDHILIDRRWHSSILDVRYFRRADCHTDHRLVVA